LCCAAGQLARRCEATSGVCFLVLEVDDMTVEKVRKIARTLTKPGQWAPLTVEDKALAAVLCPCWEARDPLVVSVGHLLSLRTAATLTAAVCREEVAEPVRQADLLGRDAVKSYLAGEPLADMRILGARAKRKGMESSVLPVIQDLLAIQAADRLGEGWKPVESRRQRQQRRNTAHDGLLSIPGVTRVSMPDDKMLRERRRTIASSGTMRSEKSLSVMDAPKPAMRSFTLEDSDMFPGLDLGSSRNAQL